MREWERDRGQLGGRQGMCVLVHENLNPVHSIMLTCCAVYHNWLVWTPLMA